MIKEQPAPDRLLRLPEVQERVGLGKTKIYALIGQGGFPRPYALSRRAVRWSEREIGAWIEAICRPQR